MAEGPHIEKVKSEGIVLLYEPTVDQVILITAQGTDVKIAISVAPGTRKTWAKCLRDIAVEIETGEVDESLFPEPGKLS